MAALRRANISQDQVEEVTRCSICLNTAETPRSLPCLHTFCHSCLQEHFKDSNPGDPILCPLCRNSSLFPECGVDGFPKQFMIQKLIDANVAHETPGELEQQLSYCDNGPDELVKMYCMECHSNICYKCCALQHQQHKCVTVETAAQEVNEQIDADLRVTAARITNVKHESAKLQTEKSKLMTYVNSLQIVINQKGEEMKKAIDVRVAELLRELSEVKNSEVKQLELRDVEIRRIMVSMESYCNHAREIQSSIRPTDISMSGLELHNRATDLCNVDLDNCKYQLPKIVFTPSVSTANQVGSLKVESVNIDFTGRVSLPVLTVDSTRISTDAVTPVDRLVEFSVDEHIWRFVGFRFPDHCQLWNNKLLPTTDNSQHVVVLRGSKQDKTDFTDFFQKYELSKVVREIKKPTADAEQLIKMFLSQSDELRKNVLVEFSETGEVEFIGKSVDVDKLMDWLRAEMERYDEQKVNSPRDAKDASTSLNVSGPVVNEVGIGMGALAGGGGGDGGTHGSGVTVPVLSASAGSISPVSAAAAVSPQFTVSVNSTDRLQFTTPFSRLSVEVCRGDLTRQRTEVIVNPANSHLLHVGGAPKAIADAAGYDLVNECDTYIRVNKSLRVTQVMHSTAGCLPCPINYVIHTCGPNIKRYPDVKQCSQFLQETFYNCLVYANDKLFVKSIALPAISSGTFGVPFDVVSHAAFSALMEFDKYLSMTLVKQRHITDIKFVNITADVTTTLINTFTSHITAGGGGANSPVLSASRRTPDDSDVDDSSVRQRGPRSATKVGSEYHNVCCVCGKKLELHKLHIRGNCTHKCCSQCVKKKCKRCLLSAAASRTERYDDDATTDFKTASPTPAAADDVPKFPFCRHRSSSLNRGVKEKSKSEIIDLATKVDVKPGDKQDSDSGDDSNGPSRLRRTSLRHSRSSLTRRSKLGAVDNCVICMDEMTDPKTLSCGHKFCKDCVEQALKLTGKCPVCGHIFGHLKGDQSTRGTMRTKTSRDDLAGFIGCGSIVINYEIPSGFQQSNHPHPGRPFKGTRRTAYLPNNSEGQEVCSMLREAFNAGLVFTVGRSVTTGEEDVVVWNDIHHKTSKTGTYGYPDYTYLTRVKSELAAKGIVPPGNRATGTATGGTVGGVTGGGVGGTSDVSAKPSSFVAHSSPSFTPSSSSHYTTTGSSVSRITSTTTFTPATTTNSSSVVASNRPSPATIDVHRNDPTDYSYTRRPGEDIDAFLKRLNATSSTRITDPHSHHTASSALSSTLTSTLTSDQVGRNGNISQPSRDLHTSSVSHSTSARNPDDYYSTHGRVSGLNSGPQSLPVNYSSAQTRPQSSPAYQSTYQSNYQSNLPVDRPSARPQSSSGYQSDYSSYQSADPHSSNISARAVVSASGHNIYRDTKSPASAASSYVPRGLPASHYDNSPRGFSSHSSSGVGSSRLSTRESRSRERDRTPQAKWFSSKTTVEGGSLDKTSSKSAAAQTENDQRQQNRERQREQDNEGTREDPAKVDVVVTRSEPTAQVNAQTQSPTASCQLDTKAPASVSVAVAIDRLHSESAEASSNTQQQQ